MTTTFVPEVARWSLGTLAFAGGTSHEEAQGLRDEDDVAWSLDVETGWWDTPEIRSESLPLPLRDGARSTDGYRSGRVLSVRGGIVHSDTLITQEALQTLLNQLDLVRVDGTLVAVEPGGAKQLTVRRAAPIEVEWAGSTVRWATTLVASDWRKYDVNESTLLLGPYTVPSDGIDLTLDSGAGLGIDLSTGSGADLGVDFAGTPGAFPDAEALNAGTADTFPVVEFRGPSSSSMTSFKVTNLTTGAVLQIDTTVNAGESLFADMRAAYGIAVGSPVTLGGVSRYGSWVSPRTPWHLDPGFNLLRFQVLAGTATGASARVTWRSAWE